MEKNPEADLRVYAIWIDVLLDGDPQTFAFNPLEDPRVQNILDPRFDIGECFLYQYHYRDIVGGGLAWDIYFLYGPDAEWVDLPTPLLNSDPTISGKRDQLHQAIRSLISVS